MLGKRRLQQSYFDAIGYRIEYHRIRSTGAWAA
jgi:hypothetical protein